MSESKKEYVLRKKYPSLPDWVEEGDVAMKSTDPSVNHYGIAKFKTKPYRSVVLHGREVENHPEFWLLINK